MPCGVRWRIEFQSINQSIINKNLTPLHSVSIQGIIPAVLIIIVVLRLLLLLRRGFEIPGRNDDYVHLFPLPLRDELGQRTSLRVDPVFYLRRGEFAPVGAF